MCVSQFLNHYSTFFCYNSFFYVLQPTQGQCHVKNSSWPLKENCNVEKAPFYKDLVFYLSKITRRTMVKLHLLHYATTLLFNRKASPTHTVVTLSLCSFVFGQTEPA